jgi:hypothetical protein
MMKWCVEAMNALPSFCNPAQMLGGVRFFSETALDIVKIVTFFQVNTPLVRCTPYYHSWRTRHQPAAKR